MQAMQWVQPSLQTGLPFSMRIHFFEHRAEHYPQPMHSLVEGNY